MVKSRDGTKYWKLSRLVLVALNLMGGSYCFVCLLASSFKITWIFDNFFFSEKELEGG